MNGVLLFAQFAAAWAGTGLILLLLAECLWALTRLIVKLTRRNACRHCGEPINRFRKAKLCGCCQWGAHLNQQQVTRQIVAWDIQMVDLGFDAWLASQEPGIEQAREEIRRERC